MTGIKGRQLKTETSITSINNKREINRYNGAERMVIFLILSDQWFEINKIKLNSFGIAM